MFEQLARLLAAQTKDTESLVLWCEACNLLSAYNRKALQEPDRFRNLDSVPHRVLVKKVFQIAIVCVGENCESRIEVIAPTGRYHDKFSVKTYLEANGSPDSSVHCKNGHPPAKPMFIP